MMEIHVNPVSHCIFMSEWHPLCVQWNLSAVDTIGTQLAVLYREVSLIQRWICTQLYVVGTGDSVLIREVPPFRVS